MARETTVTAEVKTETIITCFKVFRFLQGGGYIEFDTLTRISIAGDVVGESPGQKYTRNFADLPATFPVLIGGNTVPVAGQTILDALDAVADAAMGP
jgi:hypothetical protein